MSSDKVLVLCATGKMGRGVAEGLVASGFEVYGTTRSAKNKASLEKIGVKPIVANYIVREDIERALQESGCKLLVFLTDFFLAAKGNKKIEEQQGKQIVDAAKAAKCEYVVFLSVADGNNFGPKCHHIHAKPLVEEYFLNSGLKGSILRPVAFFENFDDANNYNPLSKGAVKFLSDKALNFIATYDVGKAAAVMFRNQSEWNQKKLACASWNGSVHDVAAALTKVSNVPSKGYLAMPICLRSLFLSDLHHMCLYYEAGCPNSEVNINEFLKVVPDAMNAEAWFRHHKYYANGEKIC